VLLTPHDPVTMVRLWGNARATSLRGHPVVNHAAGLLLRENMENVIVSFLRRSSLRIRPIGLACLAAGSLIAIAAAGAEPHATSDSGEPVSAASTAAAEPDRTSLTVADGVYCTERNRHDVVCSWGRLGDGHGMLVRCLTSDEARRLAQSANEETGTGGAAATVPSEERSAIVAVVNSVVFEGEHISSAKQNLAALASDYQSCVARHGGLRRESGEVRIRFHLNSRGVARDTSVSRRRVVTIEAAHCIAGIVSHQFVGVPRSKASVGTLVVHFTRVVR
jgi:hypothetical protein